MEALAIQLALQDRIRSELKKQCSARKIDSVYKNDHPTGDVDIKITKCYDELDNICIKTAMKIEHITVTHCTKFLDISGDGLAIYNKLNNTNPLLTKLPIPKIKLTQIYSPLIIHIKLISPPINTPLIPCLTAIVNDYLNGDIYMPIDIIAMCSLNTNERNSELRITHSVFTQELILKEFIFDNPTDSIVLPIRGLTSKIIFSFVGFHPITSGSLTVCGKEYCNFTSEHAHTIDKLMFDNHVPEDLIYTITFDNNATTLHHFYDDSTIKLSFKPQRSMKLIVIAEQQNTLHESYGQSVWWTVY
jgi:hypothetical protein